MLRAERSHARGWQRHTASRALSLRSDDQQFTADALKGPPDAENSFAKVYVRPAEAQQLTAPQIETNGQFVRGP